MLKKRTVEPEVPVEEKKSKSNIDLRIVGKIDLDTIAKENKPAKKEEHKEKAKAPAKEKLKEKEIPRKPEPIKEPEIIEEPVEEPIP